MPALPGKNMLLQNTKEVLVAFLRAFLANPQNYVNISTRDFSGSNVYVEDFYELRSWPNIVIYSTSPGQMITTGLSDLMDNLYDANGRLTGYRYGGVAQFNILVDIATKTSLDRDLLTDLVARAYRQLLRRYLEAQGVLIVNVNYSGQAETPYNTDLIYTSTLSLATWSTWYEDYPLMPIDTIQLDVITPS